MEKVLGHSEALPKTRLTKRRLPKTKLPKTRLPLPCSFCGHQYSSRIDYRWHMTKFAGKCVDLDNFDGIKRVAIGFENRVVSKRCIVCRDKLLALGEFAVCKDCILVGNCEYCGINSVECSDDQLFQKIMKNSLTGGKPCNQCVSKLVRINLKDNSATCSVCEKTMKTKGNICYHIVQVHIQPKLIPKCEKCGTVYDAGYSGEQLLQKIIKNTGDSGCEPCRMCVSVLARWGIAEDGKYKCLICEYQLGNKTLLEEHIISIHTSNRPYKCDYCGKAFKLKAHLSKHFDIHKVDRSIEKSVQFVCSLCGLEFFSKPSFRHHMEKHENKIHRCSLCDKQFQVKRSLNEHIQRTHLKKRTATQKQERIQCNFCSKSYPDKSILKTHTLRKHGSAKQKNAAKKYRCGYCTTGFYSRALLEDHENTHTGNRPHGCDICGKSFMKKVHLVRHKNIHTGEKKYKCDTCGLSFNQKCTLTRHQVVHTGEKPFECGICGQRFTQKPYMKLHEKKHKEGEVVTKKQKKKKKQESSEESEEDMSEEESMTENETSEENEEMEEYSEME